MTSEDKNLEALLNNFIPKSTYCKDLQEFAEWTCINNWDYSINKKLWENGSLDEDMNFNEKTTSQLLFDWEVETGRKEK